MATPKTTAAVLAVVALFLASLAAYLVYDYFQKQEATVKAQKMEVQPVVVAAVEIPYGTNIQPTSVKLANWPKQNLPAGHFSKAEDVTGRISVATIQPGSPVVTAQLAPVDASGGVLSYIIPDGRRAITVAVNEVVGVAGFVLPNSVVDVVATVTSPYSSGQGNNRISKIILQGVKVLAVGQILEQKEGKPVVVPTVTLDVSPEDAEKLALASENKVQLILRHVGDTQEVKTKGATVSTMLGGPPPAAPSARRSSSRTSGAAKPAEKGDIVEVIKGSTRTKQEFK